jgi:hypothetical protein
MDREALSKNLVDAVVSRLSGIYKNLTVICEVLDSAREDVDGPFALLAIEIPRDEAGRSSITSIALEAFRSILDSEHISELGGIELMFRDNNHKRIVRFSVTRAGYGNILNLTAEDVGKPGPYAGVGCWIYDTTLI